MDAWEDEFCHDSAAAAGSSSATTIATPAGHSCWPAGEPGYTASDLTHDPVALLDALGLPAAHLVGVSMGGGIAQDVAGHHPDRVASLTLISTSPAGAGDPDRPELPPPSADLRATFHNPPPDPDWSDRERVIDAIVDGERPYLGSIPLDVERARALAGRVVDRTADIAAAMRNHDMAESGDLESARTDAISAPTLVLHGTDDPLFPFPHGEALAREIPDATLFRSQGWGTRCRRRRSGTS